MVTFNVKSRTLSEHYDPEAIVFQCPQKPALLGEGNVMALVVDNNSMLHLAKFEREGETIKMRVKESLGHSQN